MNKQLNTDIEISDYFSESNLCLRNEFELLGVVVVEMFKNGTPLTEKSLLSMLSHKLETENKEEVLHKYRSLLALLL